MRWTELAQEQRRDLDYKIQVAVDVLGQAFQVAQRPCLAFSGGKDSTALLDLVRRFYPDRLPGLSIVYGNTGMEFPECIRFVQWLAREWRLDLHVARPGRTDAPGFRYAAQRRIWERLIRDGSIQSVLRPGGKLKSTAALERACPADLRAELESDRRMVWPAGTQMSYWWCVDQYGWPLLGKTWSRLDARRINVDTFLRFSQSESSDPKLLAYYNVLRQAKISQHCCAALKKEPAARMQEALGADLVFKGLMAAESRARSQNFMTRGYLFEGAQRSYLAGRPFFHCQPLAIWTDADVWAYIERYSVPYAPLYDLTYVAEDGSQQYVERNGCIGCGTDFGFRDNHLRVLRQTHRRAWLTLMRAGMAEQIRALQQAMRTGGQWLTLFDTLTTDQLITVQPCALDDLDGLGGKDTQGLVYDDQVDDPGDEGQELLVAPQTVAVLA